MIAPKERVTFDGSFSFSIEYLQLYLKRIEKSDSTSEGGVRFVIEYLKGCMLLCKEFNVQ